MCNQSEVFQERRRGRGECINDVDNQTKGARDSPNKTQVEGIPDK